MNSTSPSGNYKTLDRLHLLRLTGNPVERAQQHGEILKKILASTTDPLTIHTLAHKNQTLIERAIRTKALGSVYEALIFKFLIPQLPKHLREIVDTVIRASGTEAKEAWLAIYQPDMVMVLAALTTEKYRNLFLEGIPGCSTAMVTKTPQHEFYFSRNLDYPAASAWERWPAVFYHEPTNAQRYFHAASLGIHTAGLTGANESGIAFGLHAHFSKKISLRGQPIFLLGDQLLEQAHNLDEAIAVLKKFKTIGSWAFNLASFAENRGISVELAEGKCFVRETDPRGMLAHSNGFQNEELMPNELHFSGAVVEDLHCRKVNMESFMTQRHPHYTLDDAMMALASHIDLKTGAVRVYGNTVSVITTIQSVIFEPHTQSVYVSSRPETPTDLGPYIKLPFTWDKLGEQHFSQTPIPVNHGLSPEFIRGLHYYHRAYVAWHVHHQDADATLPHLVESVKHVPQDPHVYIQKGYFELKTGKYENAKRSFTTALKFILSPNLKNVATYFCAAAHDLTGERDHALKLYRSIEGDVDPKLRRRIKKRLQKAYQQSDCQKIQPDLQFVEPIDYP